MDDSFIKIAVFASSVANLAIREAMRDIQGDALKVDICAIYIGFIEVLDRPLCFQLQSYSTRDSKRGSRHPHGGQRVSSVAGHSQRGLDRNRDYWFVDKYIL